MNEGGRVCIGERGGGRTGWEIALGFLHSEAFQDMRQLQELLLATCFERTALALPKRFDTLVHIIMNIRTHMHARTHAHAHAYAHTCTHTHTTGNCFSISS